MSLSPATLRAVHEALDDEYKARATYRAVIDAFGPVRPFVNIVEAEERHARALIALLRRHGAAVPDDPWPARVPAPASIDAACRAGVEAEIENEAMYARLLAQIDAPDAARIMRRLQAASRDNHLPAFRRCLAREHDGKGPQDGKGRKAGRRHRWRGGG